MLATRGKLLSFREKVDKLTLMGCKEFPEIFYFFVHGLRISIDSFWLMVDSLMVDS